MQKFIISVKVVICFQISIFEPLETTKSRASVGFFELWFAFKLVSLNHWKQLLARKLYYFFVVICFQISIFEPLETTFSGAQNHGSVLWFAFKLVSLNHWKQQKTILFPSDFPLWFAFKLVSLNHWKQRWQMIFLFSVCCDLLSN